MDKLIKAFTDNLSDSLVIANNSNFKNTTHTISNVLICGMGGSGISGKIISEIVKKEIDVPILLCSDYNIPNFVNKNTLVIASSYSGNTEETISSVKQAKEKNAIIVGICSGGFVESFCKENNYDYALVPGGNQPRAALGYSLVQVLNVLSSYKLISENWKIEIENSINLINNHYVEINKLGKEISNFLYNKIPIIYTENSYDFVGVRARQQFNENSKVLGWSISIPEMNHNELVGWEGGDDRFAVIFIYTDDMNNRNRIRMNLSKEIIQKKTNSIYNLFSIGDSYIQRSLYLINVLDWASYYLHILNNVDVFDINVINHLKTELSKN